MRKARARTDFLCSEKAKSKYTYVLRDSVNQHKGYGENSI